MNDVKPHPDPKAYREGEQAARRFVDAVRQVIAVPRAEYEKRHKAWEKTKKAQRKKSR